MKSTATTVTEYIASLPPERKTAIIKLRDTINQHIPHGFVEQINCGVLGRVVPHSMYPDGYHTSPDLPLPFINLASRKNFIALYHMGIYAEPALLTRFQTTFPKQAKRKLDMGKSCIRFKDMQDIPYDLIGQLASKMTVQEWITLYEKSIKRST